MIWKIESKRSGADQSMPYRFPFADSLKNSRGRGSETCARKKPPKRRTLVKVHSARRNRDCIPIRCRAPPRRKIYRSRMFINATGGGKLISSDARDARTSSACPVHGGGGRPGVRAPFVTQRPASIGRRTFRPIGVRARFFPLAGRK